MEFLQRAPERPVREETSCRPSPWDVCCNKNTQGKAEEHRQNTSMRRSTQHSKTSAMPLKKPSKDPTETSHAELCSDGAIKWGPVHDTEFTSSPGQDSGTSPALQQLSISK